jgi:outer membrane protein OmpA-like peptidoglycan-associated protein
MNELRSFSFLFPTSWGGLKRFIALCMMFLTLFHFSSDLKSQVADVKLVQSEDWQRSHALMLENMSFYLDGAVAVDIESGQVRWKSPESAVLRRLERIVQEIASLQSLPSPWVKGGFSDEVRSLIERVSSLDHHDLRRWRMADGLSDEEQWYVLVQSGLDELKMQLAMELNYRVNAALYASLKDALAEDETSEQGNLDLNWLDLDVNAPLPAMDLEFSTITSGTLSGEDRAIWPSAQTPDLAFWMERIIFLLENQETRLMALESSAVLPGARPALMPISSDASLGQLRLPQSVDVSFPSGSASMTLNAQLQLNEVMELLCRHPQIRVVCTGHADPSGSRTHNHALSKSRARVVRDYILQSGLDGERVLLNYFGAERNRSMSESDRRVEIRFYVE